jgi:DNA-binding XRE family transcriptional regulator
MGQGRIPNKLRRCRKLAGYNQQEVAQLLGHKSANRLCRWENGQSLPNLPNALKLGALYKILVEEIYFDMYQKQHDELKKIRSKRK